MNAHARSLTTTYLSLKAVTVTRDPECEVVEFSDIQARRVDGLAKRIAAAQVERLGELALIGYPALAPDVRAVYQTALRLAAISVMDRAA